VPTIFLGIDWLVDSIRISRALLLVEAIVIVLPGTFYALWGIGLMAVLSGPSLRRLVYVLLIGALGLVPLVAGWRLITAFAKRGPKGLKATGAVWWALTVPGVLFALAAIGSWFVPFGSSWYNATALPRWSIVTAPALIPLAHLALERWCRRAAVA
jgi:hypothetical protein